MQNFLYIYGFFGYSGMFFRGKIPCKAESCIHVSDSGTASCFGFPFQILKPGTFFPGFIARRKRCHDKIGFRKLGFS